jgi:hypothetical protein
MVFGWQIHEGGVAPVGEIFRRPSGPALPGGCADPGVVR